MGGTQVSRDEALTWADNYLNSRDGLVYAYPAYDTFDTGGEPGLVDADLLAPTLLNARISLSGYNGLKTERLRLQSALGKVPRKPLGDATDEELAVFADLYGVLDAPTIPGVQATILSKVLHRKQPEFIPLYDEFVRCCYQVPSGAPVPPVRGRSWAAFMTQLADAMRADLRNEKALWEEIQRMARKGSPITMLRALDIVAWHAGRSLSLQR